MAVTAVAGAAVNTGITDLTWADGGDGGGLYRGADGGGYVGRVRHDDRQKDAGCLLLLSHRHLPHVAHSMSVPVLNSLDLNGPK